MAIYIGNDANEPIQGTSEADSLSGAGGADTIVGQGGNDSLFGGEGSDLISGGTGDDLIDGGGGIDVAAYYFQATGPITVDLAAGTATGSDGTDVLIGIEGVYGSFFADLLSGNSGDNVIQGLAGNDTLHGGGGKDVLSYYDSTGPVGIDLNTGTSSGAAGIDSFTGFEWYVGSNGFGDTLLGAPGNDSLEGWGGADSINGGDGDDTLDGGEGSDTLSGDAGQDVVIGGLGNDQLDGGSHVAALGSDWVSYEFASGPVNVNLATGQASGADGNDVLVNFERIRGSDFNDTLTGDGGDNVLRGNGGDDLIDGGGGTDSADFSTVEGTAGVVASLVTGQATSSDGTDALVGIERLRGSKNADQLTGDNFNNGLRGNAGDDTLDGGSGTDTAEYYNASGPVTVNLATGTSSGAEGSDTLTSIENAEGSFVHGDTLIGSAGANRLSGLGGDDSLSGGAGLDTLIGGAGNDTLDGGTITDRVAYTDLNFADYSSAASAVVLNLSGITGNGETGTGTASDGEGGIDTLSRLNFLIGSQFNDSITGSSALIFEQFEGLLGNDTIDGGAIDIASGTNSNRVTYVSASGPVAVNLATGSATGAAGSDTLLNINQVRGSFFGDTLVGSTSAWTETLDGREGNDTLSGGGGRDSFIGGAGDDVIDGGVITDRNNYVDANFVNYSTSTGAVTLDLSGITGNGSTGSGTASDGLGGTDTLTNVNFIIGSPQADTLTGSSALVFEDFTGLGGNDTIDGGAIDQGTLANSNRATYSQATGPLAVDLAEGTASAAGAGTDTLIHINHIRATGFADTLLGSDSVIAEQFDGGAANDTIDGRGGIDLVRFESATSAVNVNLVTGIASDGQGGTDSLLNIEGARGTGFNDTLTGGNAANGTGATDGFEVFLGGGGNDTIDGGGGFDRIDYVTSTAGAVVTLGGAGHGTASDGLGGTDVLIGIEAVRGSGFNDRLTGSNTTIGYESFEGREGDDTIDGLGGTDRADYTSSLQGVVVDLLSGTAQDGWGGTDALLHIENARGSYNNDAITGSAQDNQLQGQDGDDTLLGGDGADTVQGGLGNDSLGGGAGLDWLDHAAAAEHVHVNLLSGVVSGADGDDTVIGFEAVAGSAFNDELIGDELANILRGNAGNDVLDGGAGMDTADYSQAAGAVVVDLNLGNSTGADGDDILLGINSVIGSAHGDILAGDSGDNALEGGAGNDELFGEGGNDTLTGGAGDDTLWGGEGDDIAVFAGSVEDYTVSTDPETGDLVVNGPQGRDVLREIERIRFANQDFVVVPGSAAADTLAGDQDGEVFVAGDGNDTVNAADGDDAVYGEDGNDSANGGNGNDTLDGGDGNDTMVGGADNDTYFVDAGGDRVVEVDGAALSDKVAAGSIGGGIDKVVASINYTLGGFVENLTLAFGAGGLTGAGNELANELVGNEQANSLAGLEGNDSLTGGGGDDSLDGGAGTDSAYFSGTRSQYLVANTGSGYNVEDLVPGRDGADAMAHVEFLRFSDRYADLTLAGRAELVAPASLKTMEELYVGFFNRIPEADGLSYWIGQLNGGTSLQSIANQFYAAGVQFGVYSPTFTDDQFIAQVYDYVLGRGPTSSRPPPPEDIAYWRAYLNDPLHPEQTEGTMVLQMLSDVHTYFENVTDPESPAYPFQFVAAHLNNKAAVANYYAVELGLSMNVQADNITFGTELAALITPDDTSAALALIGVPVLE